MRPGLVPGPIGIPQPTMIVHSDQLVGPLSDADHFESATGIANFAPGCTMVLLVEVIAAIPATATMPVTMCEGTYGGAGTGMCLQVAGTTGQMAIVQFNPAGGNFNDLNVALPSTLGYHAIAIASPGAGVNYRTSLDGGNAVNSPAARAPYTPPVAGVAQAFIGVFNVPGNGCVWLRFCAMAIFARVFSDAEIEAASQAYSSPDKFSIPTVTTDATCTWSWNARMWGGGATHTSGGSSPITFTTVGAPAVVDVSGKVYDLTSIEYESSCPATAKTLGSGVTLRQYDVRAPFALKQALCDAPSIEVGCASAVYEFFRALGLASQGANLELTVNAGAPLTLAMTRDIASVSAALYAPGYCTQTAALGGAGVLRTLVFEDGASSMNGTALIGNLTGSFAVWVRIGLAYSLTVTAFAGTAQTTLTVIDSIGGGGRVTNWATDGPYQLLRGDGMGRVAFIGGSEVALWDWYVQDPTYAPMLAVMGSYTPRPTRIVLQVVANCMRRGGWVGTDDYGANGLQAWLVATRAYFGASVEIVVVCLGYSNDAFGLANQAAWLAKQIQYFNLAAVANSRMVNTTQAMYGAADLDAGGLHLNPVPGGPDYHVSLAAAAPAGLG